MSRLVVQAHLVQWCKFVSSLNHSLYLFWNTVEGIGIPDMKANPLLCSQIKSWTSVRSPCPSSLDKMSCHGETPSASKTAFRMFVTLDQGSPYGRRPFQTHMCLSWWRRLERLWSPLAWNLRKTQILSLLDKDNTVFLLNTGQKECAPAKRPL